MDPNIVTSDEIIAQFREWLSDCSFSDYTFFVEKRAGRFLLKGTYYEPCTVTGEPSKQTTRKWDLSPKMTKSEFIQTVFKCALTSMEHRTRENFLYRGQRVFGPHFDVDALHELCEQGRLDLRPEWPRDTSRPFGTGEPYVWKGENAGA